ncbi:MAG: CBS domain-containing protein [Xanthobacteraceae bacterium]|nr:MAG: CBS domain-containing protein [Xanthobacteraceae bacterium]
MIVGNWMQPQPMTVSGDVLVSEAKRLMSENKLHALPVVDANGCLRGLMTRANLLRMGHFVMRTQSADEMNFFVTRLRVRDVMVRNPATVEMDDSIEECLRKGRELGVAQFPVLQRGKVVGVISANEIFQLAAHCVGAWERRNGITLAPLKLGPGVLGRIADVAVSAGAALRAIYPVEQHHAKEEEKSVILRFQSDDPAGVVTALEKAGFAVAESSKSAVAAQTS